MTEGTDPMKTDQDADLEIVFPQMLVGAVSPLKNRLRGECEHAYAGHADIIRIVLDEERAKAWELSPFPHLFLPDLVEARMAQLGLQSAVIRYDDELAPSGFSKSENKQLFPAYVDR
jgi:hypothetical protein